MERIGHRGAKRELRENTLAAFRRAFERGADAVELDVHATRDGVVVIHHDPELGAEFGPVSGRAIAGLDWIDVEGLGLPSELGMPTLAQLLAIVPASATAYVEIKGEHIEGLVADVIRDSTTRCAVHSFDHQAVRRMRDIAPQIPRGILFDRPLVDRVHEAGGRVIAWTVNSADSAATLGAIGVDGLCTDDVRLLDGL